LSALGWFRAGGIGMIVVGLMHLSGELAPLPSDPAFIALREAMRAYTVNIMGVETNPQAIQHDLSLSFSLFSLAVGAIALAGAGALAASPAALRRVALAHVVALAALVVTNAAFRVLPPAVFYTLVAALFGMAALRARA
jgi:hypothetical protein